MNRPAPIRVSGKQIRAIRITRTGWAFILLTIGLGLGGLNTGNNLLYLVFGMLLSMLILNAILSRMSLDALELMLRLPDRIFAAANCPIRLEVTNRKRRLPSYALSIVRSDAEAVASGRFLFKIPAQDMRMATHDITFPRRGRYPMPTFQLLSSYPFGLIEKVIPLRFEGDLVVYPEILPIGRDPLPALVRHGDFLAQERGVGVNPYGIREYQYGDEVRHIHWRSVAKVGKWVVREYEQEKRARILLNLLVRAEEPPDADGATRRENTVTALASLLVRFIEQKREVALLINNRQVASHDFGYIDFYLKALALFDHSDTPPDEIRFQGVSRSEGAVLGLSEMPRAALQDAVFDELLYENGVPT